MTAQQLFTDTDDDYECFLSRRQICTITGLSYPIVWDLIRRGAFPPARKISRARVAWLRSEISEWMRSRPVQNYKPEVQMNNQRFYTMGVIPRSIPPGRVLAHNQVRHAIDTPYGVDDFKCWTWLKHEVPLIFQPCDCGWAGLPHVAQPLPKI
jgi:predicted DNA-binding transcriptional regulator AlpA